VNPFVLLLLTCNGGGYLFLPPFPWATRRRFAQFVLFFFVVPCSEKKRFVLSCFRALSLLDRVMKENSWFFSLSGFFAPEAEDLLHIRPILSRIFSTTLVQDWFKRHSSFFDEPKGP